MSSSGSTQIGARNGVVGNAPNGIFNATGQNGAGQGFVMNDTGGDILIQFEDSLTVNSVGDIDILGQTVGNPANGGEQLRVGDVNQGAGNFETGTITFNSQNDINIGSSFAVDTLVLNADSDTNGSGRVILDNRIAALPQGVSVRANDIDITGEGLTITGNNTELRNGALNYDGTLDVNLTGSLEIRTTCAGCSATSAQLLTGTSNISADFIEVNADDPVGGVAQILLSGLNPGASTITATGSNGDGYGIYLENGSIWQQNAGPTLNINSLNGGVGLMRNSVTPGGFVWNALMADNLNAEFVEVENNANGTLWLYSEGAGTMNITTTGTNVDGYGLSVTNGGNGSALIGHFNSLDFINDVENDASLGDLNIDVQAGNMRIVGEGAPAGNPDLTTGIPGQDGTRVFGDAVTVNVAGDLDIGSSTAQGQSAILALSNSTVNVGNDLNVQGGSGVNATAQIGPALNDAFVSPGVPVLNVNAGNDINLLGGNGNGAFARLHATTTANVTAVGTVTLQGGAGDDASATILAEGANTINLEADTLIFEGGSGNNADALLLSGGGSGGINVLLNNCVNCNAITLSSGTDAGLFGNPITGIDFPQPEPEPAPAPVEVPIEVPAEPIVVVPEVIEELPPIPDADTVDDIINSIVSLYDDEIEGEPEGEIAIVEDAEEEDDKPRASATQCS